MAEPYLTDLRSLLDRLAPIAGVTQELTCKHFFAGAAAYAEGHIFLSLTPVGLALKLPPARREELFAARGKPLRYFPNAPVKKAYVILDDEMASDDRTLARLISESATFCLSGRGHL
jgi:hypothetical protein